MTIKLVRPESATNLVTNPSVEKDAAGYVAYGVGTVLTRDTGWRARGGYGLKVTTTASSRGVQIPAFTAAGGVPYTVSMWVRIVTGTWRLREGQAGTIFVQNLAPGFEGRITWTWTPTAGAKTPVFEPSVAGASEAWIDAVQVEQADHATTYVDGDEPAGRWTGTPHASTSTRPATTRAGGREIDLEDASIDLVWHTISGVGMPPLDHVTSERVGDGREIQAVRANPIVVSIVGRQTGNGTTGFHALHRALVDLVKPDGVPTLEPIRLIYDGAGVEREIDVYYVAGLEESLRSPSRAEEFTLQLVAYEPRWRSRIDRGAGLDLNASVANANYIIARRGGTWQALGTGANGIVGGLAVAPDGSVYAIGTFTTIGGVAANRIARWNPATGVWTALGTGLNAPGWNVAIDAAGNVYAAGEFTTAGGVTVNYVAKWNGTTWSAMGTGLAGGTPTIGYPIVIAPDGKVWVGGQFLTAGGVSAKGLAAWDPLTSTWSSPGSPNLSDGSRAVFDMFLDEGGVVYVVGSFNTAFSPFEDSARYDPATGTWSQVSSAPNWDTVAVTIGPDGLAYIGGAFTNPEHPYVGRYVPSTGSMESLAGGANNTVRDLVFDDEGTLWAAGHFTRIGGLSFADRIARWNGSSWLPADVALPGGNFARAIAFDRPRGDLYVAGEFSGIATAAAHKSLTNDGSSRTFPVFRFRGPGRLLSIRNWTTGHEIALDLTLIAGEELTIDLRPGRKTIESNLWGNRAARVLPGASLAAFVLQPGANDVSVLMTGTGTGSEAQAFWREQSWGAE